MSMFNGRRLILVSLTITLATLPSLGQTVTNLACFPAGRAGNCSSFIDNFCSAGSSVPVSANNSVSLCFNAPAGSGFLCDFTAWRGAATSSSPPLAVFNTVNCEAALTAVSNNCTMGGSAKIDVGQFYFTVDPNNGNCGNSTVQA